MSVRPFYLVFDESASMGPELDTISRSILDGVDLIFRSPDAVDALPLAIYGFSDDVVCYRRLASLDPAESMPVLSARGGTQYGPVLRALRSDIDADVARLKAEGISVQRPVVVFVTDGDPLDPDWRTGPWFDPDWHARPVMIVLAHEGMGVDALRGLAGADGALLISEQLPFGRTASALVRSMTVSLTAADRSVEGRSSTHGRSLSIRFPDTCVRVQ